MIQAERFKGRLGFKTRSDTLLNQGLVQAVDMLDDYGHPPAQINTRATGRIELESDQYRVVLRLRRLPLRMGFQIPAGIPAPAIFLDVTIERLFPTASDKEITELLLAVLLRRLSEALSPLLIFWQDAPKAMSRETFLAVFEHHDTARQEASDTAASVARLSRPVAPAKRQRKPGSHARPAVRKPLRVPSPFEAPSRPRLSQKLFSSETVAPRKPRVHVGFTPVEAMADDLERQCDRRAAIATVPADQVIDLTGLRSTDHKGARQNIMTWAATGLIAMLSAPIAVLVLMVELMRGSQLQPRSQILTIAVFVGLLQGTGMVQAAAKVLMLPAP